jgi:hypothetical protein
MQTFQTYFLKWQTRSQNIVVHAGKQLIGTTQSDAIIEQQNTQVIEQTMKQLGVCHELRFIMYLIGVACNIERCFDKT